MEDIRTRQSIVVDHPRVAAHLHEDGFSSRVAEVIRLLIDSLDEVRHPETAHQLAYLNWSLCQRAGGALCECGATAMADCCELRRCQQTPLF